MSAIALSNHYRASLGSRWRFARQVLPQERQGLAHDLAGGPAVIEEVEGVWPFGVIDERHREIFDERMPHETVDGGVRRVELVAPGS